MRNRPALPLTLAGALLCVACGRDTEPPTATRGGPELEHTLQLVSRQGASLEVEVAPDGVQRIDLDRTHMQARVVRMRTDGTLEHACVASPAAARAWLEGAK